MTTDLAVRSSISSIGEIQQVARLLAMSNYFDAKGNGEQAIAQLATKILAGQEMGYGPFASVQGIHVIQGKPTMSANLMASAVKNSARYDYRVRQMEDTAVSVEFFERIGGKLESLGVSTFTIEDAKKAGTQNLQKFARNMLFARAMSNGVHWYCPDVFLAAQFTRRMNSAHRLTQMANTSMPPSPRLHRRRRHHATAMVAPSCPPTVTTRSTLMTPMSSARQP